MIRHLAAALIYLVSLLQFSLSFAAEDPSGNLIAGWIAWFIATGMVVWDILDEE